MSGQIDDRVPGAEGEEQATPRRGRLEPLLRPLRPLAILLADPQHSVRQSLKGLLERQGFVVAGEAADGLEAVRLAGRLRPDVVVLDLDLPLLDAVEAARQIRQASPMTAAILLSREVSDRRIEEALQEGIRRFVLKSRVRAELPLAVAAVSRGRIYMSPSISQAVVDARLATSNPNPQPLTRRERQVVQLVAEGRRTKEIAALLGVGVKTAESHRTRLMRKLDIHETAGLVRYAIRQGLIQL